MAKTYIHLGMPKTASTAMQEHVFPKLKSHRFVSQGDFRHLILTGDQRPCLISYENFVGYPFINLKLGYDGYLSTRRASLEGLGEIFEGAETILVVREQVGLVKSLYNQFVKSGGCLSFSAFVSKGTDGGLDLEGLKYRELIADIKKNLPGKLLVIEHSLLGDNPLLFEQIFLDFIGSNDRGIFASLKDKRSNESLSMHQVRALRFLNSIVRTDFKAGGVDLGRRGYKVARRFSTSALSLAFSGRSVFDEEVVAGLAKFFDADAQYVSALLDDGYCIL